MNRYKGRSKKSGQVSGLLRARRRHARIEEVSRMRVIKRDNSTCYMCRRKLAYYEIVLDHKIPLSRGGWHAEDNLAVACAPCNSRKGSRLPAECEWLKRSDGTLTIRKN